MHRKPKEYEDDSEIVPEEDSDHARGAKTESELEKIKNKLHKCEEEKKEYLDGWQRSQAEFANLRKRDEERIIEARKYASQDVITQIIPVLDSFDIAFANKETWEKIDKNWRIGVESIYSQLLGVLQSNGVLQLNPLGQKFNPETDEAVGEIQVEESEDGIIKEVLQKGYKLGDRVIRDAKVKVGVFKT